MSECSVCVCVCSCAVAANKELAFVSMYDHFGTQAQSF